LRTRVTSVGKSQAPPAAIWRHIPVVVADVCANAFPSHVHVAELKQSPMPRPFCVDEMTPFA
jgi:hypothetical protein